MLACLTGVEPVTHSLEGCCSIQLSYRHRLQSDTLIRYLRAAPLSATFVGVARLELATFCTQNRHATSCATPRTSTTLSQVSSAYSKRTQIYGALFLFANFASRFVLRHQRGEVIKQVMRIVRTGRCLGVILHAENRQFLVPKSLDGLVVKVEVRQF